MKKRRLLSRVMSLPYLLSHCIGLLFIFPGITFAHNPSHLGQISFPTTGQKAAQPYFEKGVMLLHSFQYEEARNHFKKAETLDPHFALAYWGEAMTYNHPLWSEQDYQQGNNSLMHFASTPAARLQKAISKKEKGFIKAINILYGKGNKKFRDDAYADAMRELYEMFPDDDEIASFYSLSLLGATESERDFRSFMQAAGVSEDIVTRNQSHPGALHYLLHSYDDPLHAPLGLRAARAYAKVAPDSSHALHMPSHIYTALGLWDDVIQSNQAAWNASKLGNPNHLPKHYVIHDLHALHWLAYAHLQKKNFQKAFELTKIMETIALATRSPMAKWYYALMRAAYLTESGDYHARLSAINLQGVELSALAANLYADFLIAENKQDPQKMAALLNQLNRATPTHLSNKTYTDYFSSVTQGGLKAARVTALEMNARLAASHGQLKTAIQFAKQATALEEQMSFGYGPPIPVEPSYELLAAYLLRDKQYSAAYKQYISALKRMPNRTHSNQGLKTASTWLVKHHQPVPTGIKPYFNRLIKPEFFH